jgi:hypothetical protein
VISLTVTRCPSQRHKNAVGPSPYPPGPSAPALVACRLAIPAEKHARQTPSDSTVRVAVLLGFRGTPPHLMHRRARLRPPSSTRRGPRPTPTGPAWRRAAPEVELGVGVPDMGRPGIGPGIEGAGPRPAPAGPAGRRAAPRGWTAHPRALLSLAVIGSDQVVERLLSAGPGGQPSGAEQGDLTFSLH